MVRLYNVICLLLFVFASYAQSYQEIYKTYTTQQEQGLYKESRETGFQILTKFPKEITQDPIRYADVSNTIGNFYYTQNKFDSAYANFSKAVNLVYSVKADTSFDYAFYLQNAAATLSANGNYQLAEKYFLVALPRLANFLNASSFEYTIFYKQYVDMKIEMGDYEAAKPLNNALIHYFKMTKGEKDTYYLNCLNNEARIFQGQGDYNNASKIYLQILDAQTKYLASDTLNIATGYNNAAECFRMMGKYEIAEPYYFKALELYQQLYKNYSEHKASVLNNMGLLYKAKSNYAQSEKCFLQSLENYQGVNYQNTIDFANPLNNLGDLYRMMGNYKKAVQYCELAVEIRKNTSGEDHEYYANAITNLALLYMDFNYYDEAEQLLLKAEKIYKEKLGETHLRYANSLNSLSSLYIRKKEYTKALAYKNQCLQLMEKTGAAKTDRYALYLDGKAGIESALGKYDDAIKTCKLAANIFKTNFGAQNYNYIDMLFSIATINEDAANYKEARNYYLQSMLAYKKIIHDNFVSMSEEEKVNFYYQFSARFETFYNFAFKHGKDKAFVNDDSLKLTLFNVRLTDKSMLLNESNQLYKNIQNNKDTTIQKTFTLWLEQKKYLQDLYKYSNDELTKNNIDLDSEEDYKNTLEKQLNQSVVAFKDVRTETNVFTQLTKQLKPNELAIEVIRTETTISDQKTQITYGALLIGKDYKTPKLITLDSCAYFDSLFVEHYKNAIQSQTQDLLSYNRFYKAIEKHTQGIIAIYFSADGVYQKLNPYTLYNPSTQKYLLESMEITQVSSLKDLLQKEQTPTSTKSIALFGFPEYELKSKPADKKKLEESLVTRFGFSEFPELPGTKKETEDISNLFKQNKWDAKLYLSNQASEEKIKQQNNPGVLHIATHGFFLPDEELTDEKTYGFSTEQAKQNPLLRCGLIMAGAATYATDSTLNNKDDGILTAYEASLLNLQNTELVTLSACETGLGDLVNGQGVYGLQRAFLTAGAKSILMSLWEVDDAATQELMTEFYKDWLQNYTLNNKRTSLRKAQLSIKQKYPNPLFWGAFVMIGK